MTAASGALKASMLEHFPNPPRHNGRWFESEEDHEGHAPNRDDRDLMVALQALHNIENRATPPPADLLEHARELLKQMYREAPFCYEVHLTDDGEIAIEGVRGEISVNVHCYPDGITRCFICMDDDLRRAWYNNRTKVFGAFLKDALSQLVPWQRAARRYWLRPFDEGHARVVEQTTCSKFWPTAYYSAR